MRTHDAKLQNVPTPRFTHSHNPRHQGCAGTHKVPSRRVGNRGVCPDCKGIALRTDGILRAHRRINAA